jgi:putative NADPH-quinone reductase
MGESVINRRRVKELEKNPDEFTVHKLYEIYPDEKIDCKREQALIESHSNLILQFPIYWFNCPPIMKKWLDEVFTYGWAYGSKGDKLKNRKVALAITAGIKKEDYTPQGRYHYTLEEILRPFEITFNYTNATYKGFTAFYGTENEPGVEYESSDTQIESSVANYISFLKNI